MEVALRGKKRRYSEPYLSKRCYTKRLGGASEYIKEKRTVDKKRGEVELLEIKGKFVPACSWREKKTPEEKGIQKGGNVFKSI